MPGSLTLNIILILAMAIGAVLRLWQINNLGYNSDEAVYAGQAAAIAQVPTLKDLFPIFRAHPLLFQLLLAVSYLFLGVNDLAGRLLAVGFGLACVYLVYRTGELLYGQRAGVAAALFMAVMPYHVVVSRQVLLDGPMALFATLTLYCLAQFTQTERPGWLYASGVAMGLTFLSKEPGIVMVGAIYMFLALVPAIQVRVRDLALSVLVMVLVMLPFPLSLALGGGSSTGQNYLIWQLFRRPNHDLTFYGSVVYDAIGLPIILMALAGLWLLWRERSWREVLLLAWIVVPVVFFEIWPTKGFQYLLPIAPAIALLAGRLAGRWVVDSKYVQINRWLPGALAGVVALGLLLSSWDRVQVYISDQFTAGTGGIAGGREMGAWIQANVPQGGVMLTVGPSMANLVEFYGRRKAFGLSVSPNPLHRNPSYTPVFNPDLQIRSSEVQYIVWDSYSAARTSFFEKRLLDYAKKYKGRVVHTESVTVTLRDGSSSVKPVIVIYEVRP